VSTEQEGGGAAQPAAGSPGGEGELSQLPPPVPPVPPADPASSPAAAAPSAPAAASPASPASPAAPAAPAEPSDAAPAPATDALAAAQAREALPAGQSDPWAPPTVPQYLQGDGAAGSGYGAAGYGADGGAGGGQPGPFGFPPQPQPPKKRRGGLVALLAAVAIVAGAIGGGIGAVVESHDDSSSTTITTVDSNSKALNRPADSVAGIAQRALPSVVTIEASGSQESGTGSGFVFDTQGHILTNNHVVAPAVGGGKLTVKLADGSSYSASVVGRASGYDVAVIKIDNPPSGKLKPLTLGNSDDVAVGDPTVAIGAPFGLSGTVTSGIVSAKNRPVASGDETGSQTSYMNAIQTDASINPGNSGGPLLNGSGQVIGIDSAIQSTSGGSSDPFGGSTQSGSIGLGFAIPINEAKRVAEQLIKTGKPVYPIIGVLRNDDYSGNGAQISPTAIQGTPAVTPGGPAAKAGLKPGDVITKFDGVPIDSGPTLVSEIWSHVPGQTVTVEYTRDGKAHTTQLTLGSRVGDQ